jgi:hypothetical protein
MPWCCHGAVCREAGAHLHAVNCLMGCFSSRDQLLTHPQVLHCSKGFLWVYTGYVSTGTAKTLHCISISRAASVYLQHQRDHAFRWKVLILFIPSCRLMGPAWAWCCNNWLQLLQSARQLQLCRLSCSILSSSQKNGPRAGRKHVLMLLVACAAAGKQRLAVCCVGSRSAAVTPNVTRFHHRLSIINSPYHNMCF